MKTTRWVVMALLLMDGAGFSRGATNEVSALLQKGLFEEEANRNLDAAIQAYQAVITQTEKDRQFAATALFRLGECYRKLGKTNEANVAYQRVVREFPDQTELVKLSQGYVGSAASPAAATITENLQGLAGLLDESSEAAQVKKIQAMIKDSPDLINAYDEQHRTPLLAAAANGQLTVAKFLLDNKADLEAKTKNGYVETPLLLAAKDGRKEMVELLLNSGANVNAVDNQGNTALHNAAMRGYKSVAEVLLAHGAPVNARGSFGCTPLYLAAQNGFKSVAELLLAHGADVSIKDNNGGSALEAAVSAGNRSIAELLLANKADVNNQSNDGSTPLMHAVSANQLEAARLLLEHGAEVNAGMVSAGHNGKWTALFEAVSRNENELVKLLLEHGADPNLTVDEIRQYRSSGFSGDYTQLLPNSTPLMLAARWRRNETAAILLAHRAEVNLQDTTGNTALFYALGDLEMFSLMMENKAKVNLAEKDGYTPLMRVADAGPSFASGVDTAGQLLAHGADVNARNKQGWTALHMAVNKNSKPMVELLLAHKADPNIKNNEGNTPLDLMAHSNNPGFNPGGGLFVNNGPTPMMVPGPYAPYPGLPGGLPGQPGNANTGGGPEDISALLREHGAVGEIERSTIRVGRKGAGEPRIIFRKDANSFNHFTLLELIREEYPLPNPNPDQLRLAFPEFTSVSVQRRTGMESRGKGASIINLLNQTNGFDCSKDILLELGDVVEIPEREHTLGEARVGITQGQDKSLKDCLKGQVKIIVKGQASEFDVIPGLWPDRLAPFLQTHDVRNILRSSSDLTHVTVRRIDPATKQTQEIIVNTQDQKNQYDDVWLRDGDVIEVPEVQ